MARVGLYAGVSTSFYLLTHLMNNPDKLAQLGGLQIMVGNDKDHLTSQLAYRLNITGPCVTVQASCCHLAGGSASGLRRAAERSVRYGASGWRHVSHGGAAQL